MSADEINGPDLFRTMAAAHGTRDNRAHAGIILGMSLVIPFLQEYSVSKSEFLGLCELAYKIAKDTQVANAVADIVKESN